ncbi:hypothetical protein GJ744_003247 [Endocarpon pusillum]|uniref:SnoaL-like domain-containing protein n=1 Tax=Endocarpon pusillum TaxID=364733 RepID=A0A8H7AB17_9EURO|nr:hypothetical protein GJ744_003247 [Endocarpon pusillum]
MIMISLLSLAHSLPHAILISLALLNPISATSSTSCTLPPAIPPATIQTSGAVLPLSALPDFYYQPPIDLPSADLLNLQVSESQIRNKLSLYSLAVDGKDFDSLSYVFSEGVVADFSTPVGVVSGLTNLKEGVRAALEGLQTHTQLGTQVINIYANNTCTASSLTYFIVNFNVTGEGTTGYITGQFRDRWFKNEAGEWFSVLRLAYIFGTVES